jgi:uncharacterized protein
MSGLMFDIFCYALLVIIWFLSTRIKGTKLISIAVDGAKICGPILEVEYSLSSRVGLLNTPVLQRGSGLLLRGVNAVHSLGMHYDIDVIFLDEQNRILSVQHLPKGTSKLKGPHGTKSILELGAGSLDSYPQLSQHFKTVEVLHDESH